MIFEVASPDNLPERWRNYLHFHHEQEFGYRISLTDGHWWFADFRQGQITGFAGMKHESQGYVFIGPCVVHPPFRGKGLQRKFITYREWSARKLGYAYALSYTHFQNYSSANNFIKSGYAITTPWYESANDSGTFIYWKKRLQ